MATGGGGPASAAAIASACDHVCQCAVESGFIAAPDKPACVTDCSMQATEEGATSVCVNCIQGATCDGILNGDACELHCNPPDPQSDAGPGGGAGSFFSPR